METLARAAWANAVLVSVLAPAIYLVDRACRRPALAHRLWLVVLLKLVTPPLVMAPLPGTGWSVAPEAVPVPETAQ